jgi:uncharacterized protein DUF4082/Big-like domain-containing protein
VQQRGGQTPSRRVGAARALLVLIALLSCAASARPADAASARPADAATGDSGAGPWALFPARTVPSEPPAADSAPVELGVRFSVAEPPAGEYRVTAVRFYRAPSQPMVENRVFIYDKDGELVARGLFVGEGGPTGVIDVRLLEPLTLRPGETYTASYLAQDGGYSYEYGAFDGPIEVGPITFPADAGVFRYGGGFPRCSYEGTSYYVSPVIELDSGETVPPPPAPVDTTIPSVSILEPSDLATVPADASFYVRARLTDDGGVLEEARLLIDGTVVESVQNPWNGSTVNFPVTLPPGPHLIEIRAEDPAGNVGEAALRLTAASTTS